MKIPKINPQHPPAPQCTGRPTAPFSAHSGVMQLQQSFQAVLMQIYIWVGNALSQLGVICCIREFTI